MSIEITANSLRRVVLIVALLNLAYFGVEFTVASTIKSVSLFADSIDFLEDAAVNGLILIGLAWSIRNKGYLATGLAALMLVPSIATLWAAWSYWAAGTVPDAVPLTLTGLGALAVNLGCAFLLARVRHAHGSLTRVAFLSARNDALANIAIMIAGAVIAISPSRWPDLIVGMGIFLMNMDAAREVMAAVKDERAALQS